MNGKLQGIQKRIHPGAKETPRRFVAPIITLFRWMNRVTDEVMKDTGRRKLPEPAHEFPTLLGEVPHGYQAVALACMAFDESFRNKPSALSIVDNEAVMNLHLATGRAVSTATV